VGWPPDTLAALNANLSNGAREKIFGIPALAACIKDGRLPNLALIPIPGA
jgi:hypothetical protein